MEAHSGHEPLLLSKEESLSDYARKRSFLLLSAKWVLKFVMYAIFISWVAFIFLFPSNFVHDMYRKWMSATQGTLFGVTGSLFMLFSAPVLLIAILAVPYLVLSGKEEIHGKKTLKYPRFRLWTFPVVVDGPFGIVSAAEIIGIFFFAAYIVWAFCAETVKNTEIVFRSHPPLKEMRYYTCDIILSNTVAVLSSTILCAFVSLFCVSMIERTGLKLGLIGLFCLAFLFLPVARGSILLRLVDIPFEHATKYHIWLGHLTMALFSLHGLFYVIAWTIEGRLIDQLMEWKNDGVAHLPGVISLLAGLFMWVTSLPGVRRIKFELFFYTHQLYVIFIVFLALHIGDFRFCYAAGGIFLFMLDRFLRFCQSRTTVDILSARSFPCGTMELVLRKPANLHYNAIGWFFLQIRELSWLQWHPFSVSSNPLEGKHHVTILVKVLGDWTRKLEGLILNMSEKDEGENLQPCPRITASVEGPYGHESAYYLEYENLILVAGGIGISPFLAILSDILHRIRDGKHCRPRNVLIIWAVKTSNELPLLHMVDIDSICPTLSDALNLEFHTYVTQESEPPLEEGNKNIWPDKTVVFRASGNRGMSVLVGTGNILWLGIYTISSTVGLIFTVALLDIFYINPHKINYWWYKGLLFIACMAISVLLFGGLVISLWHVWERRTSSEESEKAGEHEITQQNEPKMKKSFRQEEYVSTTCYGQRPDIRGIFDTMSDRWGNVDIGVIVCGPPTLITTVAKECRTQNLRRRNQAIFHFNTHSFDL